MQEPRWGKSTSSDKEAIEASKGNGQEIIYKEQAFVERVDNHFYFYADVGREQVLQLNKNLRQLNNDLLHEAQVRDNDPSSIFLHINSYGGGIFHGLAAMDAVLTSRVPIISIIDGCCASAATFMSVAAKERRMPKHGFMLIHQLSTFWWGKYEELKDEMTNLDRLMVMIKDIYAEHTRVPEAKLEEILKHDLWFDADTCLEYGMVDVITGSP